MPELPEVETIKNDLQKKILNKKISAVVVYDQRVIRQCSIKEFIRRIKGKEIASVNRRGKAIMIRFKKDPAYFVIQVMMTGQLIHSNKKKRDKATKITFTLSNRQYLHYNDQRLFGRLQGVDNLKEIRYFQVIGPEPLGPDFNIPRIRRLLDQRTVPIKTLLMNHAFVAGIGNIYASEILFRCRINPIRPAKTLRQNEIATLHRATIDTLNEAIKLRGTSMHTYRDGSGKKGLFLNRIQVYGREDEGCPRCQSAIQKVVLGGRSTFYCPKCQNF